MSNLPSFIVQGTYIGPFGVNYSRAMEMLMLGWGGAIGDRHHGITRKTGKREVKRYPQDTEIRNYRQISIVSTEELAVIAQNLGIDEVKPEWLGANLLVSGLPDLTGLAPTSRLAFAGGAVLMVFAKNLPCAHPGKEINKALPDVPASAFVPAAKNLRGLLAWVERPLTIRPGETAEVFVSTGTA